VLVYELLCGIVCVCVVQDVVSIFCKDGCGCVGVYIYLQFINKLGIMAQLGVFLKNAV